ncbi:uncharacterized protein [Arachis hypogaea]|uniref:uncharacterized protein isoform X1 n=2 Tax=Arachis hypogaea TaxID=3818 RepID=UPI003B20F926
MSEMGEQRDKHNIPNKREQNGVQSGCVKHNLIIWTQVFMNMLITECADIAGTPPDGCTEIPTCPVCLERLDPDRSGILTTLCDHSFQCPCVSKWTYLSCRIFDDYNPLLTSQLETQRQLPVYKIIFVQMVHTDGITT